MIRRNFHPLHEIKTMRVKALHAGVELKVFATVGARLLHEPIEKLAAASGGTIGRARDQIIHIHESTGEKRLQNPVTSHGPNLATRFQKCQKVTVALLLSHAFQESVSPL